MFVKKTADNIRFTVSSEFETVESLTEIPASLRREAKSKGTVAEQVTARRQRSHRPKVVKQGT